MIKTVKIDDANSIELNGSFGWLMAYRTQFGRDILPELMPLLGGLLDLMRGLAPEEDVSVNAIADIDEDILDSALIRLSGLEFTTMLDIVWAMAKNADDSIPEPRTWLNSFDVFPMDKIIPAAFEIIMESSVTVKNSRRLLKMLKSTK